MITFQKTSFWTIVAIIVLSLAVGISCYWNILVIRTQVVSLAEAEAKSSLKRDLAFRLWSTSHGGIYLWVNEKTQPSPLLSHIPERDVRTPSGGMLTLQNPAASLREIKAKQNELYGELARITGRKYLNPENAPDAWELKALDEVEKSRDDFSEVTEINGVQVLRRMQPMWMEQGCVVCHAWTGIPVGGLRGGTDVAIPLDTYFSNAQGAERSMAVTHGGIYLIGLTTIAVISRRARRNAREARSLHDKLEHLSRTDPLTGLMNRRYFMELAEQEVLRAQRYKNPLSILLIDVDHFKLINDTYGHGVGDNCLQSLGTALINTAREVDMICRYGGEEFVILLPETMQNEAMEAAERIRIRVESLRVRGSEAEQIQFTISTGVATLASPDMNIDALIRAADTALYEAKNSGRNKVCMCSSVS